MIGRASEGLPRRGANRAHGSVQWVTLGLLLVTSASCGSDSGGPTPQIDQLSLGVSTAEWEPPRWLMVVGETGSAYVLAFRDDIGTSPGRVSFTSSSPATLAVRPFGDADAELAALAVGSAIVRASAQGRSDTAFVDVVATPLPVDHLRVRLAPISSDVEATYDIEGSLATMQIPIGGSVALDATVERAGRQVAIIPFTLTSSDAGSVRVDDHCRSSTVDPQCSVFSPWGWVSGVGVGTSTVTVTVRNVSATFLVNVQ
jgi:hypothetical protein